MADISSHFQEAIDFIGELNGINVVPGSPFMGCSSLTTIDQQGFALKRLCLNLYPKKSHCSIL